MIKSHPISYSAPFCIHQQRPVRLKFDSAFSQDLTSFQTAGHGPRATAPPQPSSAPTADGASPGAPSAIENCIRAENGCVRGRNVASHQASKSSYGSPRTPHSKIRSLTCLNKLTKLTADQHRDITKRFRHGDPLAVRMERFSLIAETFRGSTQYQTTY